jgi:uncharacterized metal-binding protein
MKTSEAVGKALAVDGCPLDCSAKCLEQAGLRGFLHLRASDAGFKKGRTPVTPEAVEAMAAKARSILASSEGRE